jgi:DNA repair protein RadA/Sms
MDKPIDEKVIAFGEVGLGGELRGVSNASQRIAEAERLGFTVCILPRQMLRGLETNRYTIKLAPASSLREAFAILQKMSPKKEQA